MKKNLFIFLLLVSSSVQAQNVFRVNNFAGVNAPYTTIQAAVAAASAGDIILVEGSPTAYNVGALDITKKLTIRGHGFFLNENLGLQANQNPATIGSTSFSLSPGSDGSVVSGLTFSIDVTVKTSNITISNNVGVSISLVNASPTSNILIMGNYLSNINSSGTSFTNVIISNNVIINGATYALGLNVPTFGSFKNNIMFSFYGVTLTNCDVVNNIFTNTSPNIIAVSTNSTIRNNVFEGASQSGADGTNLFNATSAALFVGLTGHTTDTQWTLKSGSVAIGAGALGDDCGIYGGVTPYKISGIASGLSTITSFNVPATVPQNGTLNVKVSAKVN